MQKIKPCLWFNNQGEEAVSFYVSVFKNSKIGTVTRYGNEVATVAGMPEGSIMTVTFQLEGKEFMALNGGPSFRFSPAISFFVNCNTPEEIDEVWLKLSEGGTVLMELATYPFSEKFGWLNDKFGVSWQLNLADRPQKISPSLMFVREQHGKAEEAMNFYISLFENSGFINIQRYVTGEGEPEGTVKHEIFYLNGQEFMATDSSQEHSFTFTPAISFMVNCQTQDELDAFWDRLSEGGEEEQCGWLKDRYGVSWQIVPAVLGEMMQNKEPQKLERVMNAILKMKKLDIEGLVKAYDQ